MKFQQGHKKTGGRMKGTPNKATVEIKELAREILEDPAYQKHLRVRIIQGKAERIEALLYHYAYGRPVENITSAQGMSMEDLLMFSHLDKGKGT